MKVSVRHAELIDIIGELIGWSEFEGIAPFHVL